MSGFVVMVRGVDGSYDAYGPVRDLARAQSFADWFNHKVEQAEEDDEPDEAPSECWAYVMDLRKLESAAMLSQPYGKGRRMSAPTLEELLERGEVEYAVMLRGDWSDAEVEVAHGLFAQGVKMGKRVTLERTLMWLEAQKCGNDGGCMVMSVTRRMCTRCALRHRLKAELAALSSEDATRRTPMGLPSSTRDEWSDPDATRPTGDKE